MNLNACHSTSQRRPAALALLLALPCSLLASDADLESADKSRYHLFHPTPADQMREMSTDRPDQTESAYTLDAGHFQIEMDFANGVLDQDRATGGDVRSQIWSYAPMNLKLGLLNNMDIQFVLDPYVRARIQDRTTGSVDEASGFGEFQTRLKVNLWGNDGGCTAVAVMPFVKWPLPESSLRNGKTEGGIIVPWAVQLPANWGLGGITEFHFLSDAGGGRDTEYFNTIALSHDIIGNLGAYLEFAALVTPESGVKWQGQVDLGFTYSLNRNTQLDFGCNFGVTDSAPDYNPFIGMSWRL